jgi:colanic acid biosynthesis glycosyl transferase WcaI
VNLLVHDFAGHPFPAELSRALAARGASVVHASCGGITTGQGSLSVQPGDPPGLRFASVSDEPFERYSPIGRARSELAYGRRLAALARSLRPDVVISANTPLLSQAQLWPACRRIGARRIYWLQDFLGRGVRSVFTERHPALGATAGRGVESLETMLLRGSDGIIAIADDFGSALDERGVRCPRIVVENWAPLDEIVVGPKSNPWSRSLGLADVEVALYAGTLGLKHDPEHLVAAARLLAGSDGQVVVVTEGLGREVLERVKREERLENLRLLDFVPYEQLGDMLAAADVCLVLLEPEAGTFSVPSKVLSYLAAGRPVVGAIPSENLAARTIARAGAGVVVEPGDHGAFAAAVASALGDPTGRAEMGASARAYAEQAFDIDVIAERVAAFVG